MAALQHLKLSVGLKKKVFLDRNFLKAYSYSSMEIAVAPSPEPPKALKPTDIATPPEKNTPKASWRDTLKKAANIVAVATRLQASVMGHPPVDADALRFQSPTSVQRRGEVPKVEEKIPSPKT